MQPRSDTRRPPLTGWRGFQSFDVQPHERRRWDGPSVDGDLHPVQRRTDEPDFFRGLLGIQFDHDRVRRPGTEGHVVLRLSRGRGPSEDLTDSGNAHAPLGVGEATPQHRVHHILMEGDHAIVAGQQDGDRSRCGTTGIDDLYGDLVPLGNEDRRLGAARNPDQLVAQQTFRRPEPAATRGRETPAGPGAPRRRSPPRGHRRPATMDRTAPASRSAALRRYAKASWSRNQTRAPASVLAIDFAAAA